jgi:hypothetical protein
MTKTLFPLEEASKFLDIFCLTKESGGKNRGNGKAENYRIDKKDLPINHD